MEWLHGRWTFVSEANSPHAIRVAKFLRLVYTLRPSGQELDYSIDTEVRRPTEGCMDRSIACVVGARPNFVKMGPILLGLRKAAPGLKPVLIHTGQHYDEVMSDLFFQQLGLPNPDVHLEVGSGAQGEQTAKILARYEEWLVKVEPKPSATLVVGDVNSTMACGLASIKLGIPVIHVEAGLRSFDRTMPEEINRVVTDAISDLLLVSEPSGLDNLRREGRPDSAVRMVGNVMIDVLFAQLPTARSLDQPRKMGVEPGNFVLWTMHRPSNVDDPAVLGGMVRAMQHIAARGVPVVFPCHPRTKARLEKTGLWAELTRSKGVKLGPPLGYLEFLGMSSCAKATVTDSGGLQEESTVLGIPCLTMRENTERPITVTEGTSTLVGRDYVLLENLLGDILDGRYKSGSAPELWDGKAGERIGQEVVQFLKQPCDTLSASFPASRRNGTTSRNAAPRAAG
jgi:UDP-N-acetylglucosamine 2-epimerase (non-hydrolysing)